RSRDRNSVSGATSSNFQISVAKPLHGKYLLSYLTIPNSVYNVNSTNNIIYFRENSTDKTATITSGYYNSSSITTAIKTAMDTASAAYNTFTITFSSVTGGLTVTASTNNFIFQWSTYTTNS